MHDPSTVRAKAYHLFALAFDHPIVEMHGAISSGEFRDTIWEIQEALSLPRSESLVIGSDFRQFEADYISLFELGARGAPACSLQENDHTDITETDPMAEGGSGRNVLFQTLLRFYHHFGLRLTDSKEERRLPDHLCCQLEALAFLAFKESQMKNSEKNATSYQFAQRDFIQRHLGVWLPRLSKRLQARTMGTEAETFFAAISSSLLALVNAHSAEYQVTETPGSAHPRPQFENPSAALSAGK